MRILRGAPQNIRKIDENPKASPTKNNKKSMKILKGAPQKTIKNQ